ncbi:MerR family transcriptional regulator [bacterium]|nr:MerR family transcriptional regulator [bacterium]
MESGLLSLEDVLAESEKLELEVSERTFRYYSVLGLLPRPVKRPPGSGDARVHYYEPSILERLRQIRALQAEGHSLKQVKKLLEASNGSGSSALIRAVADGRFTAACQQFLQSGSSREASAHFLRQLAKLAGEGEPGGRELEACLRQLGQWHAQSAKAESGFSSIARRLRDIVPEDERAEQVQRELLGMVNSGRLDSELLLELRAKISK